MMDTEVTIKSIGHVCMDLENSLLGVTLMLQALGLSCEDYHQFANFELIHTLETY